MKHYTAPWCVPLVVVSWLFTGVFLWVGFGLGAHAPGARVICLGILVGCVLFTIRGYTITPEAILIHRLFWSTRLTREGLCSAKFEPRAMHGSLRAGNGGVFSFSGLYWNRTLGLYRAFVTDTRQTVVLRYPRRTVVLSPGSPEEFARDLIPTHAA
ncbi:MAG TPA: PH domain-containing protein [Verrucomicrobiae bacterium]|nr:PH domain-containing protein [Verrucomicrobiae bacterium]